MEPGTKSGQSASSWRWSLVGRSSSWTLLITTARRAPQALATIPKRLFFNLAVIHPMPDTEQLYGWYSDLHLQAFPKSYAIYATPDGSEVKVTNVCHSSSDPGIYAWRDARCVGPVVKLIKIPPVNRLLYSYSISRDQIFIKTQDTIISDKFARLIKDINPKYH